MDWKVFALWGVVILVTLEITSFFLGVPADTLVRALARNASGGVHESYRSDRSQCIEWEYDRCRLSVDDLRRRLD